MTPIDAPWERGVLSELQAAAAAKWAGDPAAQRAGLFARAAAEIERLNAALAAQPAAELDRMRRALHDICEEWAGAECGEPVYAQEAYAIGLARRMYALAADGLNGEQPAAEPVTDEEIVRIADAAWERAKGPPHGDWAVEFGRAMLARSAQPAAEPKP